MRNVEITKQSCDQSAQNVLYKYAILRLKYKALIPTEHIYAE